MFLCSLGAKNEELESKTARQNGASKRQGRGHVSFLARSKPKMPFLGLSLLRNLTGTLATQARRRSTYKKSPERPISDHFRSFQPATAIAHLKQNFRHNIIFVSTSISFFYFPKKSTASLNSVLEARTNVTK